MPNNPLYPGYSEKKKGSDQVNPLYPGYYTGQPLPRRPKSKDFVKPIEYDFDTITEHIDEIAEEVKKSPINFPGWFKDRLVDDYKQALKASYTSKAIKTGELDDYATEDLPGAIGASLSLNIEDWKDPKKQAAKTLKSWAKASIGINIDSPLDSSWDDVENKMRGTIWGRLTGHEEERLGYAKKVSTRLEKRTKKALEDRTKQFGTIPLDPNAPFNLKGIDIEERTPLGNGKYKKVEKKNIYRKTADSIISFEELKQSPKSRDGNYDKFVKEAGKAINSEVKSKYYEVQEAAGKAAGKGSNQLNFTKNTLDSKKGTIDFFDIKNSTVGEMGAIQEMVEGRTKNLQKYILGIDKQDSGVAVNFRHPDVWKELDEALKKTRTQNKQLRKLEQARNLAKGGGISKESFDNFEKTLKSYDDYLTNLESTINDVKNGTLSRKAALKKLKGTRGRGKNLTGGDIFKNSIQRDLIRDIERDISSTSADAIGSVIANEGLRSAGMDFHGRKIIPIKNRLSQERLQHATEEMFEDIWDGGLAEKYLWNKKIKPRLGRYTPEQFVKQRLNRSNYFGLMVGDNFDPGKRWEGNAVKIARWKKRNQFNFNMKFSPDDKNALLDIDILEKWNIPGLKGNVLKLPGGDHFKVMATLTRSFDFKNATDVATMRGLFKGTLDFTDNTLLQQLKSRGLDDMAIKEMEQQIKNYQKKLRELRGVLGKKNVIDGDFQFDFLKKLQQTSHSLSEKYNITTKYAARLDKVFAKLEEWNRAFRKTKLGKFIGVTTNWKTLVSERAAEIITKLLGAIAATTGIMKVLWPIIRGLIKKVIEKAIDTAQKTIKAFIKMDFDEVSEVLNENAKKAVRGCVIILLPPLLLIWFVIFFIFNLFAGSISPVDPTMKTSIPGGARLLENPVIRLEKHVYVTLFNGDVLTNPERIENEEVQKGITVEYTVKVTPKVTITDGSVKLKDDVYGMGGDKNFFKHSFGERTLDPFEKGEGFDEDYGPIEFQGNDFKDSYIINRAIADTPAVSSQGIFAGNTSASRAFMIGKYVSQCPLGLAVSGYQVIATSQGPDAHGNDSYWEGICRNQPDNPDCWYKWPIPYTWKANYNENPRYPGDPYYGYALDVAANDRSANNQVTLPNLGLPGTTWEVTKVINWNPPGYQGFEVKSSDGNWRMSYTHINESDVAALKKGQVIEPGVGIGTLSKATPLTPHVHIELFDTSGGGDGFPVKPEKFLCINP